MSSFFEEDPKLKKTSSFIGEGADSYTVAIIGYSDSGKSSMVFRFIHGAFYTEVKNDPTIEDNYKKNFWVDNRLCTLHIIDTGGSVYDDMHESWIIRADGIIIVYDCTKPSSLKDCQKYVSQVGEISKKKFGPKSKQRIPIILVGSKNDLEDQKKVTAQQGLEAAIKYGCWFKEVSAVTGQSIDLVFQVIVSRIRESNKRDIKKKTYKRAPTPSLDLWTSLPKQTMAWTEVEVLGSQTLIDISKCQSQGFHFEIGKANCKYAEEFTPTTILDLHLNVPFYNDQFFGQDHINLLSNGEECSSLGPVCITLESPGKYNTKAIIRLKDGDKRIIIPAESSNSQKEMLKYISKEIHPDFAKLKLTPVEDPVFPLELVDFEKQGIITKYKIGILNVKEGQKDENQMYANVAISPDFDEFLKFIGKRVMLLGFEKFRGGLDVKTNTTGKESVYTEHLGYEIMFHVAPLLPDQPQDEQRVEKKRHLGNDVVVIIFKEGPQLFDPLTLTSHFNHVFIVIQPIKTSDGKRYRVEIANHEGVPPYPPFLPATPEFELNNSFREFLLTKILNAERASMYAPSFKQKLIRTRKMLLENLANNQIRKKK